MVFEWLYFGSKILYNNKNKEKNGEYDYKYAVKSTKNIQISFPKTREGGRTVGSGSVATIIE